MSVRDEDLEIARHHGVSLYGTSDVEVPAWAENLIGDQVNCSPPAWTPRLVWEDLREAGHHGISEEMVAQVMRR